MLAALLWLKNNWVLVAAISGALVLSAAAATLTHKLDAAHYAKTQQTALDAQRLALVTACDNDKKITSEVSRDFQDKNAILVKRLAADRVRPATCVPLISSSAGGRDGKTPNTGLPQPHGIDAGALIGFAGDAEQVGLQLDACQNFVRKVEAINHK